MTRTVFGKLIGVTTVLLASAAVALPASASADQLQTLINQSHGQVQSGLLDQVGNLLGDLLGGLLTGQTAMTDPNCTIPAVSTPFSMFGDRADYFLIPGGSFATGAPDWWLSSAAAANGVLNINNDGSAITAPFCVGNQEPTFRLIVRSSAGAAQLTVNALFIGLGGQLREQPVATIPSTGGAVQLTPALQLSVNYRAGAGKLTEIALVFGASGGNWSIADPYIDPFRSN